MEGIQHSSRNSLIALAVLLLATASLGVAYYSVQIEASSETATPSAATVSGGTPLKAGWNTLKNGPRTIDERSEVISLNGSLLTIEEAKRRALIGEVSLVSSGKVWGENLDTVGPGEEFKINVLNAVLPLAFYPESVI
ncbi:MAG: hypothetical protein OEV37_03795 [Candidatus Berkelbacteria bacterium]|nr:hypothetical protein [Candidatus Berkelbacteria bacterium]